MGANLIATNRDAYDSLLDIGNSNEPASSMSEVRRRLNEMMEDEWTKTMDTSVLDKRCNLLRSLYSACQSHEKTNKLLIECLLSSVDSNQPTLSDICAKHVSTLSKMLPHLSDLYKSDECEVTLKFVTVVDLTVVFLELAILSSQALMYQQSSFCSSSFRPTAVVHFNSRNHVERLHIFQRFICALYTIGRWNSSAVAHEVAHPRISEHASRLMCLILRPASGALVNNQYADANVMNVIFDHDKVDASVGAAFATFIDLARSGQLTTKHSVVVNRVQLLMTIMYDHFHNAYRASRAKFQSNALLASLVATHSHMCEIVDSGFSDIITLDLVDVFCSSTDSFPNDTIFLKLAIMFTYMAYIILIKMDDSEGHCSRSVDVGRCLECGSAQLTSVIPGVWCIAELATFLAYILLDRAPLRMLDALFSSRLSSVECLVAPCTFHTMLIAIKTSIQSRCAYCHTRFKWLGRRYNMEEDQPRLSSYVNDWNQVARQLVQLAGKSTRISERQSMRRLTNHSYMTNRVRARSVDAKCSFDADNNANRFLRDQTHVEQRSMFDHERMPKMDDCRIRHNSVDQSRRSHGALVSLKDLSSSMVDISFSCNTDANRRSIFDNADLLQSAPIQPKVSQHSKVGSVEDLVSFVQAPPSTSNLAGQDPDLDILDVESVRERFPLQSSIWTPKAIDEKLIDPIQPVPSLEAHNSSTGVTTEESHADFYRNDILTNVVGLDSVELLDTYNFGLRSILPSSPNMDSRPESLMRHIVAFLNEPRHDAKGRLNIGRIFLGVSSQGLLKGLRLARYDRDRIRQLLDRMSARNVQPRLDCSQFSIKFHRLKQRILDDDLSTTDLASDRQYFALELLINGCCLPNSSPPYQLVDDDGHISSCKRSGGRTVVH